MSPADEPATQESPTLELTVEELSERTGISVRNLRFYTTRGLVPPPAKRGRTAIYGREHVARFELLQELQAHGLTLSAIERFFEGIPADATAEQIALQRATLRPLAGTEQVLVTRKELDARAGRKLGREELESLTRLGGVTPAEGGKYAVTDTRFRSSLHLLDLGVPTDLVLACEDVYRRHSKAMAEELEVLFRETVWPAYKAGDVGADQVVAMVSDWEQGGITSLVEAFTEAVTEARRTLIERRSR
ncbi:transcriptional regulator [Nocardioides phosphati]|uniref:Transcriptional regulator n=1 Tax=Nocardioides phosphati TaxID=1867775 RepID=A0ABQ2NEW7_9ACTN|nr:MerR family transcriptional regulator [Nocardioides phosphati]GGO93955.1 transcriptional regulator [Nocardioides phosphati]